MAVQADADGKGGRSKPNRGVVLGGNRAGSGCRQVCASDLIRPRNLPTPDAAGRSDQSMRQAVHWVRPRVGSNRVPGAPEPRIAGVHEAQTERGRG